MKLLLLLVVIVMMFYEDVGALDTGKYYARNTHQESDSREWKQDRAELINLDDNSFDTVIVRNAHRHMHGKRSRHMEDTKQPAASVPDRRHRGGEKYEQHRGRVSYHQGNPAILIDASGLGQATPIPMISAIEISEEDHQIIPEQSMSASPELDETVDDDEDNVMNSEEPNKVFAVGDTEMDTTTADDDEVDAESDDIVTQGSGSGDDASDAYEAEYEDGFVISGEYQHVNVTSDEDDWFLDEAQSQNITDTRGDVPAFCEEQLNSTWASWSPWIQLGDRDFRFRRCHSNNDYVTITNTCRGEAFESRQCMYTGRRACRRNDETDSETEEFRTECHGLDLDDIDRADALRDPFDREDDCQYELYDMKYKLAIGKTLSSDDLLTADPKLWCSHDDMYMPFYTPKARCLRQLRAFCKNRKVCEYPANTDGQTARKSGFKKLCWKESVLDGAFPEGIPASKAHQMICQKFDKESRFGEIFGSKDVHYATLYDTALRMPVVSMATVMSLGDNKWPDVPYMVERSLVKDDTSSLISWVFKEKKRGMTTIDEITSAGTTLPCTLGQHQALPSDFDHSNYRPMPLLSPAMMGRDLAGRLSAFSMTNIIPVHRPILTYWKKTMDRVMALLGTVCSHDNDTDISMHILSGAVSPNDHYQVIGNDVTVPEIVWLAACCVHEDHVSALGVYVYNQYGQTPTVVSVENLQLLLQSNYRIDENKPDVNLFPSNDGACSARENDVSDKITNY